LDFDLPTKKRNQGLTIIAERVSVSYNEAYRINMNRFACLVFLLILPLRVWAQEDYLHQIVRTVFYNPSVSDKLFFDYTGDSITFMDGYPKGMRGAFILPDTTLQKQIPNLLHLIGTSHGTEKYFMTITFLSRSNEKVFITSHIMDPAILLYVDFDQISVSGKNAIVKFHTTSFPESKATKLNHFKVSCDLTKHRKGWKIRNLHVDPIDCCTPLW